MVKLSGIRKLLDGTVYAKFEQVFEDNRKALLKSYQLEDNGWIVKLEKLNVS